MKKNDVTKSISLEGLRGLACLAVVNAHFWFVFLPYTSYYLYPPQGEFLPKFSFDAIISQSPWNLILNGSLGVCIFFVISGYVLTVKYYKGEDLAVLRQGAIKRYPRLVLPAFVSIIFAYFLFATGQMRNNLAGQLGASTWASQHYSEATTLVHSIYAGLIGAPVFGDVALNVPLWTLNMEITGSFLLFALYSLFGTKNKMLLLLVFTFFSIALGNLRPYAFFMLGHPLYYMSFLLGSFLNITYKWLERKQTVSGAILVLGLLVACIDYSPQFSLISSIPLPNLTPYSIDFNLQPRIFYYTISAVLIVAGILGFRPATKILSNKVFEYLGKISFSIYLLHWPIICSFSFGVLRKSLLYTNEFPKSLIICFILTYLVIWMLSDLFYRLVDRPTIKFSSWLARKLQPTSMGRQENGS